jgi:hypothetical protein
MYRYTDIYICIIVLQWFALQGIMIRLFLFQILNTLGACLIMWGNDWDNWYAQVLTSSARVRVPP